MLSAGRGSSRGFRSGLGRTQTGIQLFNCRKQQDEDVNYRLRTVSDAFKTHLGLVILDQMPTKEFRSAWGQISVLRCRLNDKDLCITLTELQARL